MNEREQLEHAISTLESYADLLGAAVAGPAIAALREKLANRPQSVAKRARRKQITVLFADLAGFTAMSEQMDAEDVNHIINELWERLDHVIVQYEGYIDKHMGDGVMALWGVRTAREDDPERAIRAGLAMQTVLRQWCSQHPRYAHLTLRVGIHTGLALLGVIGTLGEYTAVGDTVNVASRLEEAAPNGRILISHDTYRHVRGLFEVYVQEPVQLKGKQEPVPIYLVEGVNPHAFHIATRGVEGIETRTIDREEEQAHLQAFWLQHMSRSHLHLVVISGEAGIGKSRLLYDFQQWMAQEGNNALVFQSRATQTMMNVSYSLVRDLFAGALYLGEGEGVQGQLQNLLGRFMERQAEYKTQVIAQVLGFELDSGAYMADVVETPALRKEAFEYVAEFLTAALRQQRLILYLEDIHWADDGSLDLLAYVGTACRDLPLFLVCTTRPSLFSRRRLWPGLSSYLTQVDLRPLPAEQSRALVAELLRHVEQIPESLYELVVGMSGGNPYYIEEIIRKLIEDEVVLVSRNAWQIRTERLSQMHVPTTLVGTLQARLDSLPSHELVVLRKAAVVGRVFWDTAVAALYIEKVDEPNEEHQTYHVQQTLAALCQRELITELSSSAFADSVEYVFKHHMLHEVTYDTILRSERKLYHGQVAQWLAERVGEQPHFAALIAEHLEQAEDVMGAAGWYRRAGEQATRQMSAPEALDYLTKALVLTDDEAYEQQFDILLSREILYHRLAQFSAQQRDLRQLQKLASFLQDHGRQAQLEARMAEYGA